MLIKLNAHVLLVARKGQRLDRARSEAVAAQFHTAHGNFDILGPHHQHRFTAARRGLRRAGRACRRQDRGAQVQTQRRHFAQKQVGCAQKARHEARRRIAIELLRCAGFQQPAHLHDADTIRQRKGFLLIVCDQNGGHADASLHGAHGLAQFNANFRVQGTEGLIEQQYRRLMRERPGDRDTLLLAAGKLARVALVVALECHQLQQLLATAPALRRAHAAHAQCKFNVLRHGHVTKQCVMLEYQAHATRSCR